jgi:DNA helicase II / ATP-dependent DNA helicase PcrA
LLRWAENPRDRVAGFRVVQLLPGAGPATATKVLDRVAERADAVAALDEVKPPAAAAEHWPDFVEAVRLIRGRAAGWPAELDVARRWYEPHLQRIHDDAMLRQADLLQLVQIASTYPSRERFLTELTLDPPDATSDRAGAPLLDVGLSDPFDHPFGEGAGMEVGPHSQCGRRLSSVGSFHRHKGRA